MINSRSKYSQIGDREHTTKNTDNQLYTHNIIQISPIFIEKRKETIMIPFFTQYNTSE